MDKIYVIYIEDFIDGNEPYIAAETIDENLAYKMKYELLQSHDYVYIVEVNSSDYQSPNWYAK